MGIKKCKLRAVRAHSCVYWPSMYGCCGLDMVILKPMHYAANYLAKFLLLKDMLSATCDGV